MKFENINLDEVQRRYRQIAKSHGLRADILQDVIKGRAKGLSNKEIAQQYDHHENTVSKYKNTVKEEISNQEFREILLILSILSGGLYLLENYSENRLVEEE